MRGDDSDTPLSVRLPGRPDQSATPEPGATPDRPEASAHREPTPVPIVPPLGEGEISWIARGRAKVVKPGPIRARALVPGALSIPRPQPSRALRLGQAAVPFPRRVRPEDHPDAPIKNQPATAQPSPEKHEQPTIVAPHIRAASPNHPVRGNAFDPAPDKSPKDRGPVPMRVARRAALPIVAAAIAALAAAAGYLAVTDRPPADNRASAVPATTPTKDTPEADRPANDPFGSVAAAPAGAPTRLRIGAVKIDTPLEKLGLGADGSLQPPKTFAQAGWYAGGTAPGDTGPAVIAGHVDSQSGPAVFYRLRDLTPGDRVDVVRGGRTVSFTVTAVRWYPKSEFPTEEVYGPTPDRQLRLITCGGVFDRTLRSYRDNLVVYAVAG